MFAAPALILPVKDVHHQIYGTKHKRFVVKLQILPVKNALELEYGTRIKRFVAVLLM